MSAPVTPATDDLIERLRPEAGNCPFCGQDPYHYVNNGVGMERVAVVCCDLGIGLFQHGDEQLAKVRLLMEEAAARIEADRAEKQAMAARIEVLTRALTAAVDVIEKHVPDGALGYDGYGDPAVPGGFREWPIRDEHLHCLRAVLSGEAGK